MRDIQFISYVDQITSVSSERESSNPYIIYVEVDPVATYVNNVMINDFPVPFIVYSEKVIRADITTITTLHSLSLAEMVFTFTSSVLTALKNTEIVFSPGSTRITQVEGIQKLSQQVIKLLLTGGGSNRWAPEQGTELLDGIGATVDISALSGNLVEAVSSVEGMIIQDQVSKSLPLEERLVSLSLVSMDSGIDSVTVKISMTTAAGSSYTIPLAV